MRSKVHVILIAAMLAAASGLLFAQATHIQTSGTLPASCRVGDIYQKTGASAGFYTCTATNTWTAVGSGTGDVVGPASATTDRIAVFDGTTGKLIKDGGTTIASITAGAGATISTTAVGSEPGSPSSGDLDFYNNGFGVSRYSGSAWVPWGPIWPLTDPTTPSWSWVNQGSATVATTNGAVFLNGTADASANLRIRVKSVPTAPYIVTAAFIPLLTTANYSGAGLILRNSGSGNLVLFDYLGDTNVVEASKWSSPTAAVAAYSVNSAFRFFNPVFWFRIEDNNTNRIFSVSADGVNFAVIFTVSRTDYITPDQIGFFVKDQNATYAPAMTLLSWKES